MALIHNPFQPSASISPAERAQIIADAVAASSPALTFGVTGAEPTTGLVAYQTQYYRTDSKQKVIWDGSTWVVIGDGTITPQQIADLNAASAHALSAHAPADAQKNEPISLSNAGRLAFSAQVGQIVYDTDLAAHYYFDGTVWLPLDDDISAINAASNRHVHFLTAADSVLDLNAFRATNGYIPRSIVMTESAGAAVALTFPVTAGTGEVIQFFIAKVFSGLRNINYAVPVGESLNGTTNGTDFLGTSTISHCTGANGQWRVTFDI